MLWLSLYLPHLPLEIYTRGAARNEPLIVASGQGRQRSVLLATPAAVQLGVQPGMSVAAACALAHELRVCARDPAAEARALEGLAAWAGQYTSLVSLQPPQTLLLEIGGSLNLFGGVHRLWSRIAADLAALGYAHAFAAAPTPSAAHWLAYAGQAVAVANTADIAPTLGRLPLSRLPWPPETLDRLQGVGLRHLRDLQRLPRDAVARRFGADFVLQLDRALGNAADPRAPYQAPPAFASEVTLPAPSDDSAALLFVAHRLLLELAGFLRGRGAGVQHFRFVLAHPHAPATTVAIGLGTAHRQIAQWRNVVREHFDRLTLRAPVESLQLRAEHIMPIADRSDHLFDDNSHGDNAAWLDRVRARLGDEVINGICAVAEHRPEYAWRPTPAAAPAAAVPPPFAERPLWLLAQALPLSLRNGKPWHHGALHLVRGPERITTGWWDHAPVARDYFIAENAQGGRMWVYRDHHDGGWFLHGVFG